MSEQSAPESILSGINIPKVLAGALAAVCAAVVGSFLGVAGTLAGAAVASVVGSIGTEIYERSLQRGAKKLQTLAPTFVKAPAAVGTPEVAAATEEDSPSHTVHAPGHNGHVRWGRILAAAAGVFVLAMGAITAYEWITGEPIASAVGASNDTGTTLTNSVSNNSSTDEKPAPTTSTTPTDQPTTVETTTPEPTASTGDIAPTPATGAPTTAPTTVAPSTAPQQTDPGTGTGSGSGGGLDSGSGAGGGSGQTAAPSTLQQGG